MKASVLIAPLCILLWAGSIAGAQVYGARPCDSSIEYENHNMIDYRVVVRSVKGTVVDLTKAPLPNACIAVFDSNHSKLLRTVESDAEGKFDVAAIRPGRYWLVVKDQQRAFCPMATRLDVRRWRSRRELTVHMDLRGIDRCSYCEAK